MQRKLMASIFAAIAITLFGAYAVVNWKGEIQKEQVSNEKPSLDGALATGLLEDSGILSGWFDSTTEAEPENKNNTTQNIARTTFEQMKKLDQQGVSPFNTNGANSFAVQSSVARAVGASTGSLFASVSITNNDLKIEAVNTQDAKRRYLKALETTLGRHPVKQNYANVEGGLQGLVEQTCLGDDNKISSEIAQTYRETARDVVAMTVPSQWVDFHKQMVMHYQQGDIIFSAIANCPSDPLKGLTVAQALPEFIMNATTLQKLLRTMYTEVGL